MSIYQNEMVTYSVEHVIGPSRSLSHKLKHREHAVNIQ